VVYLVYLCDGYGGKDVYYCVNTRALIKLVSILSFRAVIVDKNIGNRFKLTHSRA